MLFSLPFIDAYATFDKNPKIGNRIKYMKVMQIFTKT